jgi:hypothetical protein
MLIRDIIRKTIIRQAQKRQRPGTGSSREFLARRMAMVHWPDLTPVLSPIPWAVVGAVASRLYMPERATADLDVAVRASDGHEAPRRLQAAGYRYQGELSISGSTWLDAQGVAVEVLEIGGSWFTHAVQEAQKNRDPQGLPALPLPYLILMKFQAGHSIGIGDIARMLGLAAEDQLTEERALFEEMLPDEREDLESLIRPGKLELEGL